MSKTSYRGILVKVWRPHYQSNRRFYANKERGKKRDKKHITFKISLPVSHHIRTEVPQEGNLWAAEKRHRRNTADVVKAKECGNTGGRGVCRPHTYAGEHSTVPECSTVHGISQGKEQFNDFRQHANLKYKYGSRNFWCRGYYVDTVGRNKKIIAEYIRNQPLEAAA